MEITAEHRPIWFWEMTTSQYPVPQSKNKAYRWDFFTISLWSFVIFM